MTSLTARTSGLDTGAPGVASMWREPDFSPVLQAARSGEGLAFERLYRWVGPQLSSYAAANGIRHTAAFSNDVFLDVAERLNRFQGNGGAFRSWVFALAGGRLVTERRTDPTMAPAGPLEEALSSLSATQRDVILLRLIAGLDLEHVAKAIDKPVTAAEELQRRGLRVLQSALIERAQDSGNGPADANALPDELLEGLLIGAVEGSDERFAGSPAASWFVSARRFPFADPPVPDQRLLDLFASIPSSRTSSKEVVAPVIGVAPTLGAAHTLASTPSVASSPLGAGGIPAPSVKLGFTDAEARPETQRPFMVAPVHTYRRPITAMVLGALRPTPTKGLIVVSVLLVGFIGSQLLGLFGDGSGSEVLPKSSASVVSTIDLGSTTLAVDAVPAPTSLSTTTVPVTPAPTRAPAAPSAPATTTTVTEPSTSATPTTDVPESSSSIETTPTEPTTSLPEQPTSIPTSVVDPIEPTVLTTPNTPTTVTPTSTPAQVSIPTGVPLAVPGDVAAGAYSARVTSILGCAVEVTQGGGNRATFEAGFGNEITFQVAEGSLLITSPGCPQTYRPAG